MSPLSITWQFKKRPPTEHNRRWCGFSYQLTARQEKRRQVLLRNECRPAGSGNIFPLDGKWEECIDF